MEERISELTDCNIFLSICFHLDSDREQTIHVSLYANQ